MTQAGIVAVLGAPNAGKSTLVNACVGVKVSIVSPKVQTTRARVMGIVNRGTAQIVFVDTPGIFQPKKRLDRAMVAAAWGGAQDADLILLIVDAARGKVTEGVKGIVAKIAASKTPAFLVLNKVDQADKKKLLGLADQLFSSGAFTAVYMISALNGSGLEKLLDDVAGALPEGPHMFPDGELSDMPLRLLAAEITREKIFLQLTDELPYASTVETETWSEQDDGSVNIEQTIYIQRDSQKAIVLGKGGARIKKIGTEARLELQGILEKRVHLSLFVKVREGWMDDPERYRVWGLDPKA